MPAKQAKEVPQSERKTGMHSVKSPNVLQNSDEYIGKYAQDATSFVRYMTAATDKPRLEFNQIAFLLKIAQAGDEGISMGAVAESLEMHDSFASRNAKAFGPRSMEKPLLDQRIDHQNPKFRLLYLTEYGKKLLGTGLAIFGGEAKYDPNKRTATRLRTA